MAMRTFDDVARYTIEKIAPGNPALMSNIFSNISLLERRPASIMSLTDENGNAIGVVGTTRVGSASVP